VWSNHLFISLSIFPLWVFWSSDYHVLATITEYAMVEKNNSIEYHVAQTAAKAEPTI
jgi:hypothetical protein